MRVRRLAVFLAAVFVTAAPAWAGEDRSLDIARRSVGLAGDPALLRLPGMDLDPVKGSPCPEDARSKLCGLRDVLPPGGAGGGAPLVVQVVAPASDARPDIEAAGAHVLEFFPNSAWIVRATPEQAAALRKSARVRWVGAWLPAWKVAPGLMAPRSGDDEVRVAVRLHRGTDLAPWRALLEATPGAGVLVEAASPDPGGRVLLSVLPESLPAAISWLAGLRDVAGMSEQPIAGALLDDSSWWLQTGIAARRDYDLSAKLFRKGLTGRGLIASIIDEGIENDDCHLEYGAAVNETGWPIGPSADRAMPVPDEGHGLADMPPIRTRERKIVAYYVQPGASPYASELQHGTAVASCIVGDDFDVLAARPLIRNLGERQDVWPMRATGEWTLGEDLRHDLARRVDSPSAHEPQFGIAYGNLVQHHQPGDGVAPGAQLVVLDIGDANGSLVGAFFHDAAAFQAHGTGATVLSESFASPCRGCTDCYWEPARDLDEAQWARRDLVVTCAAGNFGMDGAGTIGGGGAHAKSAISVGATTISTALSCIRFSPCVIGTPRLGENVANFSSCGPSSGGRIAPELLAPGLVWAPSGMRVRPEDGSGSGDQGCGQLGTSRSMGTSFSAPSIAGLALLVQQYFHDGYHPAGRPTPANAMRPTNALVRAILVNSARDLGGGRTAVDGGVAHRPNFKQGWGAPRLDDTLYFGGDPTIDDPLGDTERAGLIVLNDVPNGFDGAFPLAPEPGGQTRDRIVSSFRPALRDGAVHEFFPVVANPVPGDAANELRITLAWSDVRGLSDSAPLVNDLDLEVVSPGPDGILQSSQGSTLLGDDRVYRPNPLAAWALGYTQASSATTLQSSVSPFSDPADRDPLNTVENVFIPSHDVFPGTWRVRVIGYAVPGGPQTTRGRPNFALGDRPAVLDMDGDGVLDTDFEDVVDGRDQGYALIASGRFQAASVGQPRIDVPPSRRPLLPPLPPSARGFRRW